MGTHYLSSLRHRLSDDDAIEAPHDGLALVNNLNAILERGAALADVLGATDSKRDNLIWPGSIEIAAQSLRFELMDARVLLNAWWEAKAGGKAASARGCRGATPTSE